MNLRVFNIVIFCSIFSLTQSQTCCSGGIPLSNSIGLETTEKGTLQLALNYDYNNLNTLNFESDKFSHFKVCGC